MANQIVLRHLRSDALDNNKAPQLPTPSVFDNENGIIGINYSTNYETISTLNKDGKIVAFGYNIALNEGSNTITSTIYEAILYAKSIIINNQWVVNNKLIEGTTITLNGTLFDGDILTTNTVVVVKTAESNYTAEYSVLTKNISDIENKEVTAKNVSLEEIKDGETIKLEATNVQDGIGNLFQEMIKNEEVTTKAVKSLVITLGSSSYNTETSEITYVKNESDTILKNAISFSDADSKLSAQIIELKNIIQQFQDEITSLKERISILEKHTTDPDVAKALAALTQVDENVFISEEESLTNQNLIIDSGDY